ncbi:unnamed protein product, partial [Phaeothamnion confervicola]
YNVDSKAAEAAARELMSKYEIRCVTVGGDISLPETRDKYFKVIDEEFEGRVNVMVHNAGQLLGITSENADELKAKRLRFGDGSLLSPGGGAVDFSTMRYYNRLYGEAFIDLAERSLARMTDGDGHIVGISGQGCNAAVQPLAGYDMPGSGKALMEYSMRLLAIAAGPRGINVNVVVPGIIPTDG